MGTSVAELIADRIGVMPASERRAAQTLIANYPLIGLKTVADFSQQAGVSSPTILRFVGRLGFQNYPEFQSALQDELAAQLQSPLNRAENPALASSRRELASRIGDRREYPRDVSAHFEEAGRRSGGAACRPPLEDLSRRRPLHRPDCPLHGRAS